MVRADVAASPVFRALAAGQLNLNHDIPALTGLRAIAVLMVVLQHCWLTTHHDGLPFVDHLFRSAASLWVGVDLFFVLSGFLLTRILLHTKKDRHFYRNFYARRCLRIWPLYYTLLAFAAGFALFNTHTSYCSAPLSTLTWPLTFSTNFYIAIYHNWDIGVGGIALCHLWSLAVEEHFYLFLPWVVRKFKAHQLILGCAFTVLLMVLLRLAALVLTKNYDAIGLLTPFRLDSFCAGSLAACLLATTSDSELRLRISNICFYPTAILVAVMIITTHLFRGNLIVSTLGYSLLAINFASLIGILASSNRNHIFSRALTHPALMFLGKHSYAIYLVHLPVAKLVNVNLVAWHLIESPAQLVVLGVFLPLAMTIALSVVCWHVIEKPCLRLKVHFAD